MSNSYKFVNRSSWKDDPEDGDRPTPPITESTGELDDRYRRGEERTYNQGRGDAGRSK